MKKKILSIILAAVLIFAMIPSAVFAEGESTVTVFLTVFNKGEFCKTKDNKIMWQMPVSVADLNSDGKYSLDEALKSAHTDYHANGAEGYASEFNEYYNSVSVTRLWGVDTYALGFYRNDAITGAVDSELLTAGDKITAFIYYDEVSWSDRYSYFTEEAKTVDVATEFSLTLKYSGFDENWVAASLPVATAPIGVYNMENGEYSESPYIKGENVYGDIYAKPATGTDGVVKMQFTEIGKYYVTAQYNSPNYSTYNDYNGSQPNYLVPSVCVVTVVDENIKAVISAIDAIGAVTEESGEKISSARTAYVALTDTQKALVENYDTLTVAEKAYSEILSDKAQKEAVENVTALIDAIGTVTEESGEKITAARTAYDALTDTQKAMVQNLDKLTSAETAYEQLLAQKQDKEKANEVALLIENIGKVNENSGEKITAAREAFDSLTPAQKALVTNYSTLISAEKAYYDENADKVNSDTAKYLLTNAPNPDFGGEWAVFALARNGTSVPADYYEKYYTAVEKYVKENIKASDKLSETKSTENSRLIIALTAIGKNPENVGGHNLLAPLSDFDFVSAQGLNGVIYALLAVDTLKFEVPTAEQGKTQTTRDKLIDLILSNQLKDGGWSFSGEAADPDMTSMAVTALAPYYKTNEKVKTAVDTAVNTLSAMQQESGGFASWGMESPESAAQVITALSAIGIDADSDPRFVKNGNSVYDALMRYYSAGGGFRSSYDNTVNVFTTCQAYYSIAAYNRFKTDKTALYDMSDMKADTNSDNTQAEKTDRPSTEKVDIPKTDALTSEGAWTAMLSVIGCTLLLTRKKKSKHSVL